MFSKLNKLSHIVIITLSLLVSGQLYADNQSQGQNSKDDIKRLDAAWDDVYDSIAWLTKYMRGLTDDGDVAERFDAYKAVLNVLSDNYLNHVYPDRDRPEYLPYLRPEISNYCGPNTDFRYGMVHLEAGENYRVWGTRGDAEVIDFQQYSGWPGQKDLPIQSSLGKYAQGTFDSRGIAVDKDGNFEFTFGPTKPKDGQWWQAEPDGVLLMIRDIFLDHEASGIPGRFYFEKMGAKKTGPTTPSIEDSIERLHAFSRSLKLWDVCFKFPDIEENEFVVKDWYAKPEAKDKELVNTIDEQKVNAETEVALSPGQLKPSNKQDKPTAAQLTQTYHMAFYNIKPDEALVGEWTPPTQSLNWNIHLYTRLLQNLGFIDRQTDINTEGAHLDSDGKVRFVISHKDPGVANWLDVDGRPLGTIIVRCKLCNERGELPSLKLVKVDDVLSHLPEATKLISPAEREHVLDLRRKHYLQRYQQ